MNSDFNDIEDEINVDIQFSKPYIRLQREDSNHIKYIFTRYSYEITLNKEGDKYKLVSSVDVPSFSIFLGANDSFFYNNGYLFSSYSSKMYIKKVQQVII